MQKFQRSPSEIMFHLCCVDIIFEATRRLRRFDTIDIEPLIDHPLSVAEIKHYLKFICNHTKKTKRKIK